MDAIDHRAAAPDKEQVDLSRADFEQVVSASDTDNPESANMIRIYNAGSTAAFGRGFPYLGADAMHILALPAARSAMRLVELPRTTGATGIGEPYEAYRIPRRYVYVLDVLGLKYSPTIFGHQNNLPTCAPWSAAVFERAPALLVDDNYRKAISRRSLGRTTDGREILQRTHTIARDFEYADPLRRSLQKP